MAALARRLLQSPAALVRVEPQATHAKRPLSGSFERQHKFASLSLYLMLVNQNCPPPISKPMAFVSGTEKEGQPITNQIDCRVLWKRKRQEVRGNRKVATKLDRVVRLSPPRLSWPWRGADGVLRREKRPAVRAQVIGTKLRRGPEIDSALGRCSGLGWTGPDWTGGLGPGSRVKREGQFDLRPLNGKPTPVMAKEAGDTN